MSDAQETAPAFVVRDEGGIGNWVRDQLQLLIDRSVSSPIGFLTAVSSAFAYLTVVGTPACTIIFAAGYLKPADFLKVGWRMVIMSTIMMMLAATFYWPLIGV